MPGRQLNAGMEKTEVPRKEMFRTKITMNTRKLTGRARRIRRNLESMRKNMKVENNRRQEKN